MSACVSGCSIRGEHVAECDGWMLDRKGERVECWGCLPRPAEVGVLCSWCWGRLQSVVRTLPALVEHLFECARPGLASPSGRRDGGARPSGPRCLYAPALDAADELVAMLAAWCDEVAAERLGQEPARPAGLWLTAEGDREVAGVLEASAARALVAWLDPHLEWCASQEWVGAMLADLGPASARAAGRWPVEELERRIRDVRCPGCGALSLVEVPPPVVGAERLVRCEAIECGRVMGEEDWARARVRAVVVARAELEGAE